MSDTFVPTDLDDDPATVQYTNAELEKLIADRVAAAVRDQMAPSGPNAGKLTAAQHLETHGVLAAADAADLIDAAAKAGGFDLAWLCSTGPVQEAIKLERSLDYLAAVIDTITGHRPETGPATALVAA